MIYIFMALHCEARPLIKHYNLNRNMKFGKIQVFENEEAGICLTITGPGEVAAAVAVSSICTRYEARKGDFLLNIGTCAGLKYNQRLNGTEIITNESEDFTSAKTLLEDELFVCNKIIENSTGRTFFPDMLYRHPWNERSVVTHALPVSELQNGDTKLYDMEAAAVYQAGAYFFAPHQMSFVKLISDSGIKSNKMDELCQNNAETQIGRVRVSAKDIEELMERNNTKIAEYIEELQYIGKQNGESIKDKVEENIYFQELCEALQCSQTMKLSLAQYIKYCELSGINYREIIDNMYKEKMLPCGNRREGKKRFEELKQQLL